MGGFFYFLSRDNFFVWLKSVIMYLFKSKKLTINHYAITDVLIAKIDAIFEPCF
jgi:hypothetical protein